MLEENLIKIFAMQYPELVPDIPRLPSIRSPEVTSSSTKCYMTDTVIERISNDPTGHSTTAQLLNVEFLHSDTKYERETLLFKRIASSQWKYDRIIELTDKVTIKCQLDEFGHVGLVNIGKTEIEKFKSILVPTAHDLLIEQNDFPKFKLKFHIVSILMEGSYSEEIFRNIMKKDSERIFSMVQNLSDGTVNKAIFLDACGAYFLECFKKSQTKDDLDNHVLANTLTLLLTLAEPNALVNFRHKHTDPAVHFLDASPFSSNYVKADLDNVGQNVVLDETQANIDSQLAFRLNALGVSLGTFFEHSRNLRDIGRALFCQRKAVQLTPGGHRDMPTYLSELGTSLRRLFSRTKDLVDISEAILFQKKAVQLALEDHPSMPTYLCSLGISLQYQFSRTGALTDIYEAISFQQKAIQLTSIGNPSISFYLCELASSLLDRFPHTRELTDVSEAISLLQKAVQLTPEDHSSMPTYLSKLGASLRCRFSCTGELTDISESISFLQNAVQLTPDVHPSMPAYLCSLANSLRLRFSRTSDLADLSKAVSFLEEAVQLSPEGHVDMPIYLSDLVTSLLRRFSQTGELTDISKAILLQKKAVKVLPVVVGYAMPIYIVDLEHSLQSRFPSTRELMEAMTFEEKVVQLTADHPDIAQFISLLALSLSHRLDHSQDITDIYTAISKHYFDAEATSASPSDRLNALFAMSARDQVAFSPRYDPSQLLGAHQAAVNLISHVAGLERTFEKRRNNLIDISTVSAAAAAFAFASGETEMALEWLEQGRCLVWTQLTNVVDITPLETFRKYDPNTADEVMKISQELVNEGSRDDSSMSLAKASISSLQEEIVAHLKLAHEWDRLLAKVRSMPDFKDFLKSPPTWTLMQSLPTSGVVIIINVHQDRCDALALRSDTDPLHIALPKLSYRKAENLRNSLKIHLRTAGVRMREAKPEAIRSVKPYSGRATLTPILSTLWVTIVKPILNGLGYNEPPDELLRIWWCATGPLAFLPIHAAGMYNESSPGTFGSTLSDFAISSYTPTVRALADIVKTPRQVEKWKSGLFMISQPDTPNLARIPGATEEVRRVERQLKSHDVRVLCLDSAAATVDRGIENMKSYSCVHFACHAKQDTEKPLKSGFALYDGQLDLSSIIQQRLVGADFAFLSACQTSAGDEKLSEEAVHLAAGMLAAGYRGAVATMWSIKDIHGPKIAEDFYMNLTQDSEGLSGEYAARALHYAMQNLRKSLGDSESALLSWVPYVHFGF